MLEGKCSHACGRLRCVGPAGWRSGDDCWRRPCNCVLGQMRMLRCNARLSCTGFAPTKKGDLPVPFSHELQLNQCAPAAASDDPPPRAGFDSQITGISSRKSTAEP